MTHFSTTAVRNRFQKELYGNSPGSTKTREKARDRNADVIIGISTS
jgi:hypothetical protein